MKVVSTNLAQPKVIEWNGKKEKTGIYKEPVEGPILLEETDVKHDAVVDRKYHGGVDQACYLYSADHYAKWQKEYPEMALPYGVFGENITVEGLDEKSLKVGTILKMGTAKVQVTEPRQPCYKLGIRFDDQSVIKKMLDNAFSGTYLRVLENGEVKVGDDIEVIEEPKVGLTVSELFELIFTKNPEPELIRLLLADQYIPKARKEKLLIKHGLT